MTTFQIPESLRRSRRRLVEAIVRSYQIEAKNVQNHSVYILAAEF
jgi:hypothetical protein